MYAEFGEQFEEREHDLFGDEGFRGIVAKIAELERTLEVQHLASFTAP